jgi:hypothetical protein
MKLSKKWRKMEARIISGKEDDDRPKRPVLDRDARFLSPARRMKRFSEIRDLLCQETVWGVPKVKEWVKGDTRRLYWPDGSYLFIEPTGEVRTSGGAATKAKFEHKLK